VHHAWYQPACYHPLSKGRKTIAGGLFPGVFAPAAPAKPTRPAKSSNRIATVRDRQGGRTGEADGGMAAAVMAAKPNATEAARTVTATVAAKLTAHGDCSARKKRDRLIGGGHARRAVVVGGSLVVVVGGVVCNRPGPGGAGG
jgi:hypothetical protein